MEDEGASKAEPQADLGRICRLCRSPKGVMSCIFSCSGLDTSSTLSERIMKFADVQVNAGDGLPSLICHRCLYLIELVNEFKMLCEQSDVLLRQHLALKLESEELEECQRSENIVSHLNGIKINGSGLQGNNVNWIKEEPINEIEDIKEDEGNESPRCDFDQNEDEDEQEEEEIDYRLRCPSCNKQFEDTNQLNRHILIHSQEPPFPCDFCDEVVNDKATLRMHWREHAGKFTNVCQTCGEAFDSKASLMKHHVLHDKGKPHHCEICHKAFLYKSDLRKHSVIHTGLKPYKCTICLKSFTRSTNLNKHKKLHTGKRPYGCVDCDKLFASKGDLLRHSVIHTGEKPFSCSVCSISFNRRDKLTRHAKIHESGRSYPCTECNSSFCRKEELTKHVQFSHFLPEMFSNCDSSSSELTKCKAQDINSENRGESEALVINVDPSHWNEEQIAQRGLNLSEEKDTEPQFTCYACPLKFSQLLSLKRHAITHSGQKPHICIKCGKLFSRSDKLKDHILTHLMKKQTIKEDLSGKIFKCNECEDVFKSRYFLNKPKMMHLSKQSYQCLHCSKDFFIRAEIVKHIKRYHSKF